MTLGNLYSKRVWGNTGFVSHVAGLVVLALGLLLLPCAALLGANELEITAFHDVAVGESVEHTYVYSPSHPTPIKRIYIRTFYGADPADWTLEYGDIIGKPVTGPVPITIRWTPSNRASNGNLVIEREAPFGAFEVTNFTCVQYLKELEFRGRNFEPLLDPSVTGGDSINGFLGIECAPSRKARTVTLTSSHPDIVEVPDTVTFSGFLTGTPFPIKTNRVTTPASVKVTASLDGDSLDALLMVTPSTPTNEPPVAVAQSVAAAEDTDTSITLTASDPDGDALTYSVVTGPAHGTLSGTPPNVVYTPATGFSGPDSFTFKANDGKADSNVATVSLTVQPTSVMLIGLTLAPSTVVGGGVGGIVTGTVTLSGPAPAGGVLVKLESVAFDGSGNAVPYENPSAGAVPSSVLVPAGESAATFQVSTNQVESQSSLTIRASYKGVSKQAKLTVEPSPVSLVSFTIAPTLVIGGTASPGGATGTVTLNRPAPAGGTTITLSSAIPERVISGGRGVNEQAILKKLTNQTPDVALVLPSSIEVEPGKTSLTFPIPTTALGIADPAQRVEITTAYQGVSKSGILTILPNTPAYLAVLDFAKSTAPGVWPHANKAWIVDELVDRLRDPSRVNQDDNPTCGPASVLFELIRRNPVRYVAMARDLFEKGSYQMQTTALRPTDSLRLSPLPSPRDTAQIDYMLTMSMQQTANPLINATLLNYLLAGTTVEGMEFLVKELLSRTEPTYMAGPATWNIGEVNILPVTDAKIQEAIQTFRNAAQVVANGGIALIECDARLIGETGPLFKGLPHWISLTGGVTITPTSISFSYYSHGNVQTKPIPLQDFAKYFRGVITTPG